MAKSIDRYTYRVTWSEDDQEHVGLCAEFPSLSWLEKTPEKALKGIRELVRECIEDLCTENQRSRNQFQLRVSVASLWFVFLLKPIVYLQFKQLNLV